MEAAPCVGDWLFVFPLCGFSLSLFCNYAPCVTLVLHDNQSCIQTRIFRFSLRFIRVFYLNVFYTRMILVRQDFTYSEGPRETGSAAHPPSPFSAPLATTTVRIPVNNCSTHARALSHNERP